MPNDALPAARRSTLLTSEDWWAIWLGGLLIAVAGFEVATTVAGVGRWTANPVAAFEGRVIGLAMLGLALAIITGLAAGVMGRSMVQHQAGFFVLFLLAVLAYFFANQTEIRAAGVGYAFWALLLGLVISNTIGTPGWLKPALRSELYIKTGLVLLGAEVLFNRIMNLGPPGLFVAWLVTPIVIFFMYRFGTRVLKIASPSLVIVIAAATSVCGVSAAIAVAAAARAKKEELTLAVGMTLIFTVVMMIVMPLGILAIGMDPIVGAAWIGGTVDATGAVVAAGAALGEEAGEVAAVVKMIQNVLIGVVAFLVAVYWVTTIEKKEGAARPAVSEIWTRFPKFILGFIGASLLFSFVLTPTLGEDAVEAIVDLTSDFRGWFFCLAFVSIGLESNMKQLMGHVQGGRPIQLYLVGQTFNIVLTLVAAYLAFGGILFDPIYYSDGASPRTPRGRSWGPNAPRRARGARITARPGWPSGPARHWTARHRWARLCGRPGRPAPGTGRGAHPRQRRRRPGHDGAVLHRGRRLERVGSSLTGDTIST